MVAVAGAGPSAVRNAVQHRPGRPPQAGAPAWGPPPPTAGGDPAWHPARRGSGRGRDLGVALQDRGPAAVRGHARVDAGPAGPVPLEVAVLKLHPGLAVRQTGERDLDLAGVGWVRVGEPVVALRV